MFAATHDDLVGWITQLEDYVSRFSTLSVAGMLSSVWMRGADHLHDEWGLASPLRQTFYLLGILMNSEEPSSPAEFGSDDLKEASQLLTKIYDYYAWQYFHEPDHTNSSFAEWRTQTALAMPVFLDYFNRSRIMSTHEQVCTKIEKYFTRFDDELVSLLGISATEALRVLGWLGEELQTNLDRLTASFGEVEGVRQQFLAVAESDGFEAATELMKSTPVLGITTRFAKGHNSVFVVSKSDVAKQFGPESANAFWKLAVSVRGAEPKIKYPTDRNGAEFRPLFEHAPEQALCPVINSVATGIVASFEEALSGSAHGAKYFRHRDLTLEAQAEEEVLKLFEGQPVVYRAAYEQADSQFEHDLIVFDGRTVLVVESKASRVREPLRDVSKTYVRMRDSFRGSSGIQKAFEQGNRVRSRLLAGEEVALFNKTGNELGTIRGSEVDRCFVICVTAESWGFMATDLSYFLEKEANSP